MFCEPKKRRSYLALAVVAIEHREVVWTVQCLCNKFKNTFSSCYLN